LGTAEKPSNRIEKCSTVKKASIVAEKITENGLPNLLQSL
jgi:hypothetical protein